MTDIIRKPQRSHRDKADPRCFGYSTRKCENCRQRCISYESSCQQHLRDVELFVQWDTYVEKNPGEKLEEAVCLDINLASQRDHLNRIMCEARDLVAVSLMHYHTEQQTTDEDTFSRGSYVKEIYHRWNNPTGRQLRLLRDRMQRPLYARTRNPIWLVTQASKTHLHRDSLGPQQESWPLRSPDTCKHPQCWPCHVSSAGVMTTP